MQIRKVESVTTHYSSEIANLNPEDFRNVSTPYTGNSDEEFLNYLSTLGWRLETIAEELNNEELSEEIYKILDTSLDDERILWDSRTKGSTEWFESGEVNDGEMDVEYSTI
jgi:hypothetical protein